MKRLAVVLLALAACGAPSELAVGTEPLPSAERSRLAAEGTSVPTTTSTIPTRAAGSPRPGRNRRPVRPVPNPPQVAPGTGGAATQGRRITSTAYCLTGTMANGQRVHDGAVASHVLPRGSSWRVLDGPLAGRTFTVEDTGPGATFDVWMSSCAEARQYGRRDIGIERA